MSSPEGSVRSTGSPGSEHASSGCDSGPGSGHTSPVEGPAAGGAPAPAGAWDSRLGTSSRTPGVPTLAVPLLPAMRPLLSVQAVPTAGAPAAAKPCPGGSCGLALLHYRGHGSHRVRCSAGCPDFCFTCGGAWPCSTPGCRPMCWESCSCVDCPACASGAPCEGCTTNRCAVCEPNLRGVVAHAEAAAGGGIVCIAAVSATPFLAVAPRRGAPGIVSLWDTRVWTQVASLPVGQPRLASTVTTLSSPCPGLLAAGDDAGYVSLWRLTEEDVAAATATTAAGTLPAIPPATAVPLLASSVAGLQGHGQGIIAHSHAEEVVLTHASAFGTPVARYASPHEFTTACTLLPGGVTVTGTDAGVLHTWSSETGELISSTLGHTSAVVCLAPAGPDRFLSACTSGSLTLWQAGAKQPLWCRQLPHPTFLQAILTIEDGLFLAGGSDGALTVWTMEDGVCLRTLKWHVGAVRHLAPLLTGGFVSSGDEDALIQWPPLAL